MSELQIKNRSKRDRTGIAEAMGSNSVGALEFFLAFIFVTSIMPVICRNESS